MQDPRPASLSRLHSKSVRFSSEIWHANVLVFRIKGAQGGEAALVSIRDRQHVANGVDPARRLYDAGGRSSRRGKYFLATQTFVATRLVDEKIE